VQIDLTGVTEPDANTRGGVSRDELEELCRAADEPSASPAAAGSRRFRSAIVQIHPGYPAIGAYQGFSATRAGR